MPPGTPAPAFSGGSTTIASVVRMFFAIDAAFCALVDADSAPRWAVPRGWQSQAKPVARRGGRWERRLAR
jgi:hypothetical protein